ncbi:MAG: HAMP domain-containing protein, partial [Candidatus Aminicenantes bacterium]
MKLELTSLRSKVAQRIFFLFVSCALLPITILAVISQITVTNQLRAQSQKRIHLTSKNMEQDIIQRFDLLNDDLRVVASNLIANPNQTYYYVPQEPEADRKPRFKGLFLIAEDGKSRHLFGHISDPPELPLESNEKIRGDMTGIITEYRENRQPRIFMIVPLDPESQSQDTLLAEVSPDFIWFSLQKVYLPASTNVCVLDKSNNILLSTLFLPVKFSDKAQSQMELIRSSQFEWSHRGKDYLAVFRPILLGNRYSAENWKLVLSEIKSEVLKPVKESWRTFPLIVLAALWFVLFLSIIQIRRSMVPLEKLKEGTKRLAKREFDSRVMVTSNDEFAEVAQSFNSMASQLGKQFKALIAMGEIDRDILSVLDTEKIVNTVVTRIRDVFPCKSMSITVINPDSIDKAHTYIGEDESEKGKITEKVKITPEDIQILRDNPETLLITLDENLPDYLTPLSRQGTKSFLVLPLFLKQVLAGIIALGYVKQPKFSQEDLDQARRLANQVAV